MRKETSNFYTDGAKDTETKAKPEMGLRLCFFA